MIWALGFALALAGVSLGIGLLLGMRHHRYRAWGRTDWYEVQLYRRRDKGDA